LDENGFFNTGYETRQDVISRLGKCVKDTLCMFRSPSTSATAVTGVAERVLLDLKSVHTSLLSEEQYESEHKRSSREKGKRLLFLFQRDLLPGVSGKILESKGQRDNIAVQQVSWEAKVAGWAFIGLLDVGMLFYILLFAVGQTRHRQGAWALSFAVWLVVEILFVSSVMVIVTHVFIPSLIMKDVNKIKLKLADSIRAFNSSVKKHRGNASAKYEHSPESFNAASYLFVSTRLAQQWPDLREAQIIAQFRTPWPKQSYQRESNVSKSYSKKYTAVYRSASVIAIFFLTNLLNIPPAFQDMAIQMVSTAAIGYTFLLHIRLYELYPVLVIIPTLILVAVVHFFVQSGRAGARLRLQRMFGTDKSEKMDKSDARGTSAAVDVTDDIEANSADSVQEDAQLENDSARSDPPAEIEPMGELHLPRPTALKRPAGHMTRKESTRFGIKVLTTLKRAAEPAADRASDEGKENLSSEDSDGDDGVSLPVRYDATGLHPSGSRSLLQKPDGGSGQNSKTSLTPSEEVAFTHAFSAKSPGADMDEEGSDYDHPSSESDADDGATTQHKVPSNVEVPDNTGSNRADEVQGHGDTIDEQDLSEEELPADDDGRDEGDSDEYEDSDDDSYEWEQAYEYTGDRAELHTTPAPQRQHAAQPVGAPAVSSGADGDSIFGSRTHSSDEEDENAPGGMADSASGSDLDFAQYTAKATAWAGGVREHTLAVAMYDLALNEHKSDTSDGDH
jgi:hypothetical protein